MGENIHKRENSRKLTQLTSLEGEGWLKVGESGESSMVYIVE